VGKKKQRTGGGSGVGRERIRKLTFSDLLPPEARRRGWGGCCRQRAGGWGGVAGERRCAEAEKARRPRRDHARIDISPLSGGAGPWKAENSTVLVGWAYLFFSF